MDYDTFFVPQLYLNNNQGGPPLVMFQFQFRRKSDAINLIQQCPTSLHEKPHPLKASAIFEHAKTKKTKTKKSLKRKVLILLFFLSFLLLIWFVAS